MISNKKILDCPVATTINLIGNKWKLLIIRDLLDGTKRFGELRKNLTGISQRVLTENLRDLENDGLLNRKVYAEVPPRVEYSLTPTGHSLLPVIEVMAQWGEKYKKAAAVINSNSLKSIPVLLTISAYLTRSLSEINSPFICILSLKSIMYGEIKSPVLKPASLNILASIAETEPLPLVPAICTE